MNLNTPAYTPQPSMQMPLAGMEEPLYPPPILNDLGQESLQVHSPLDRWSFREYGKMADQLDQMEQAKLIDHIIDISYRDCKSWGPRNDRMLASQAFWEIGTRYSAQKEEMNAGHTDSDGRPQVSEIVELNDGYLTVDKITSMVAGAKWATEVHPKAVGYEDAAQLIEDLLVWAEEKLSKKYGMTLHGPMIRDEVHYATLRGWITGLLIPNPKDPYLPWTYLLEDPLFVYPRFSGDELIRVIHKYSVTVLEAQAEYDQAFEFLLEKEDDDEVEIISYYDQVYCMTLLSEGSGTQSVYRSVGNTYTDRVVLKPLTRHGYTDLQGKAINPWIIVTPRGSPTRKFSEPGATTDREAAVALIGLDVLYPIKDLIVQLEKFVAMAATEMAKGVNPPRIIWYDGVNKPETLDVGEGAENFMIMGSQDAKIIESTAMKPDAQPWLNLITERLQKGSVPSVLFGSTGFSLAGYAISLLSQQAQDVVQPLLEGVKLYREIRQQRMLEMYANIGHTFAGPLSISSTDPETGIRYSSAKTVNPAIIFANGATVHVTYDEVTPRDSGPMLASAISGYTSGVLPLYDAMHDWVGLKDTRQAMTRLAEGLNFKDPMVLKHMARAAGKKSGSTLLRNAVIAAEQDEMMQMMMTQQQAAMGQPIPGQEPATGGNVSGGVQPTNTQVNVEASPPSNINPITAASNQLNQVSAGLNVANGGTPPAPDTEASILQFIQALT